MLELRDQKSLKICPSDLQLKIDPVCQGHSLSDEVLGLFSSDNARTTIHCASTMPSIHVAES